MFGKLILEHECTLSLTTHRFRGCQDDDDYEYAEMPPKSGFSTHALPASSTTTGFTEGTGYEHSSLLTKPGFSSDVPEEEESYEGFASVDSALPNKGAYENSDQNRERTESISGFAAFQDHLKFDADAFTAEAEADDSDSGDAPFPRTRLATIESVESISGFRERAESISGFATVDGAGNAKVVIDNISNGSGDYAHFPEEPDTAREPEDAVPVEGSEQAESAFVESPRAEQRAAEREAKKKLKLQEKQEKKRLKDEAKKTKAEEKAKKKALAAERKARGKKVVEPDSNSDPVPDLDEKVVVFETAVDAGADTSAETDMIVNLAGSWDTAEGMRCITHQPGVVCNLVVVIYNLCRVILL